MLQGSFYDCVSVCISRLHDLFIKCAGILGRKGTRVVDQQALNLHTGFHQAVQVALRHAEFFEAGGDIQVLYDLFQTADDPRGFFLCGLAGLNLIVAAAVIGDGESFPAGGFVEAHDRGQQDRVGNAVGDMVLAAQRIA